MELPTVVRSRLEKLLPGFLLNEITSFRITSGYPEWSDSPDIIVTTKRGEFVEILNRQVVNSCLLDENLNDVVESIGLHYLNEAPPNYVVKAGNRLYAIGRSDGCGLKVLAKFEDVIKFSLDDSDRCGEAKLRIWRFDDVRPTVLNDDYLEISNEGLFNDGEMETNDDVRVVSALLANLSEVKLNTARNRKTYEDKLSFRRKITQAIDQDSRYDLENVSDEMNISIFDKMNIGTIWQNINNGKWVIGIPIKNATKQTIEDIELIMVREDDEVFFCSTHFYMEDDNVSLSWKKWSAPLMANQCIHVVVVSDVPDFDVSSRIALRGTMNYKYKTNTFRMPLDVIELNAVDAIQEKLNPILCDSEHFDFAHVLSLLVTTVQISLSIFNLGDDDNGNFGRFLMEKLDFTSCKSFKNIFRHTKSPLHLLHGCIVCIEENDIKSKEEVIFLCRTTEQILLFINVIYDLMPVRMVIVPRGCEIDIKKTSVVRLENDTEDMYSSEEANGKDKMMEYAANLHQQMSLITQHLEKCIEEMSVIDVDNYVNKNDSSMDIDVLKLGLDNYKILWNGIHEKIEIQNTILSDIS